MPEFAYTARGLDGSDVNGLLQAASRRDALNLLSERSLFPLTVEDQEATSSVARRFDLKRHRRVGAEQVANCLTQLSDLLHNGVPLLTALSLLAEQSPHPVMQDVMTQVRDQVADGTSLEEAISQHPQIFSDLTISMIRAGSEGAFLEEALNRVASFLELQEELKGQVKGAMAYPVFLMIGGLVVTLVLIVFFVPKFEGLFERLEQQGSGLPAPTVVLLFLSDFLMSYGLLLLLPFVAIVFGVQRLLKTDRGSYLVDRWKLRLPIAGKIFHDSAVSRFCRVLGTLLGNGVPILKSLQISSGSVGNQLLAEAIRDSADNISSGQTLSAPLSECGLIPAQTMAMIRVAEESNTLDTVLINIADGIDKRIARQLTMMVRFIEPVMLVMIGGAILFVLVALLLPVFDMSTSI
ncbi:MAG: type II secretion system F family protein [Planctomycetaceae bacterium]|nr:type II secretion system F family protein [Planctomycetaceae bacterium]